MSARRTTIATSERNPYQASQTEAQFQQAVVAYAQRNGWRCHWVPDSLYRRSFAASQHGADQGERGFPDLVMTRREDDGTVRCVVAELKSLTGRVKPTQQAWIDELTLVGGIEVYVWFPDDWRHIEATLAREAVAA